MRHVSGVLLCEWPHLSFVNYMYSWTTVVYPHRYTNANRGKYKTQYKIHRQTLLFRYERLLTSGLSSTRGERETILKSLSYHTMLTKLPTAWSDPNFSASWSDPNFNCLPKWQTTRLSAYIAQSQLPTDSFSKSSNSQDRRFRAWRHSQSSPISYLGFIMTIVIVIFFTHERKLYPMLCTWTKRRIVQSPPKLNDEI